MYGTYTYIYQYHKSQPHVGKYTIHYGSYGKELTTRNDDENDDDERHQVTIDEFIDGTMKLKGAAKSTDSPEMWVKLVWGYVKFKVVCISIRLNLRFQRVTKCIYMFVCFGVFFWVGTLDSWFWARVQVIWMQIALTFGLFFVGGKTRMRQWSILEIVAFTQFGFAASQKPNIHQMQAYLDLSRNWNRVGYRFCWIPNVWQKGFSADRFFSTKTLRNEWRLSTGFSKMNGKLGGGFKDYCMLIPIWGNDPIWLIFFKWVEGNHQLVR